MKNTLPDTMKAVVCHGPGDYRLEEKPRPVAGKHEVVVRVKACGICAGDVKASMGAPMFWSGDDPWLKAPVVPGHEFVGIVVELGEGAAEYHNISLGDCVTAEQINPCGSCRFCRRGQYWMCEVHNIYGFQKDVAEGGMSEFMLFHETARIHKIPDSLPLNDAVFIEPMACAIHTVQRAKIEFDDVVVLAGAGPLGLGMVQAIKLKTPKKLVVLDMDDKRLEMALNYGADAVFNPAQDDVVRLIRDMTDGYGCDVYIEATGNPKGVTQGLEMIRKLGRFVEFSVFGHETTADWSVIGDRKELEVLGAHLGPYCYEIAIDLFSRKLISAKDIVTHNFPIERFEEAFRIAASSESIKTAIVIE